jgi:hypothetical protein
VAIRKLGRQPRELETLSLFASMQPEGEITIDDSRQQQEFLTELGQGLSESLVNEARLHGWRVQALFQALIVELGRVPIVKEEDNGDLDFEDRDGMLKLPDLRLVLEDGSTVFVEVKNVGPGERKATSIGRGELDGLALYAEKQKARLLLAHYWSAWNLWTLIDPVCLERPDGRIEIAMETAVRENEMVVFGDVLLGTTPPLTMTLYGDPDGPAALGPTSGGDKKGVFTIGAVEYRAAGKLLEDPDEIRIALAIMQFGKWDMDNEAKVVEGRLEEIRYTFNPPEGISGSEGQEFEMAGSLSSMYSTLFNLATLKDDGSVARLRREPTPGGLASLVPADYFERKDRVLRLWRFELQPNREAVSRKRRSGRLYG